jgi:hypothetical protein
MTITAQSITDIQTEINAAMNIIALKYNLKIGKNHISYTDSSFKLGMEFCDKGAVADGVDPILAKDMTRYGYKYGFSVKDIGTEFMSNGEKFKIEGMKGYTFIIASAVVGGKMYRFKGVVMQRIMGR